MTARTDGHMGNTVWAQGHRNPEPAGATPSAPPDGNVKNHAETVPPVSPQRVTPVSRCIRPRNTRQQEETADSPERRVFKATVAGSLPADVSGAVSLTKNDNGRGNAADGGPSAVPPSAHAERTFNHTPNAHGAITQRQSTGFASQKLRVRIPFVPPIPKCPSLRMAMAEMPMSGARGCDQLAKRSARWQMRGLEMTALCVYRNVKSAESFPNRPLRTELHSAASSTESAGTAWNNP